MKTQRSRNSFDEAKRYSGVYQQMGRMLLDADWNELTDLNKQRLVEALTDVIGSGTPRDRGIVELDEQPDGTRLASLFWGYAYVDGVPAQLMPDPDATLDDPLGLDFEYEHQADFPQAPALPAGDYTLYLDVWERTVIYLEDGALLDPGLHGADTCTRTQTMAQVKWCPITLDPEDGDDNPAIGNALLTLTLREGTGDFDPCAPCADTIAAGIKLGNYLFRVEVHSVEYDSNGMPQRIRLKWSSENGAEQYAIGETPTGFVADKWAYEFYSGGAQKFASEKHLGRHLATGFVPVTGQLESGYPDSEPAGYALVRRWDGYCELLKSGSSWTLVDGGFDMGADLSTEVDAAAHGYVLEGNSVTLNLENITLQINLDDNQVLAGDYWTREVRQATDAAGDVLLENELPRGILHHYMTLGSMIEGQFIAFDGDDCKRFEFPPLTDIRASDVCYDNNACDMPDVGNVQEAIDYLCQARDLRWHNKHLHGWGIVCGLIAQCGADTYPVGCDHNTDDVNKDDEPQRRQVFITGGYALTCNGDDVVVPKEGKTIDVIAEIEKLEKNGSSVLADGKGSVCLRIDLNDSGEPVISIEPYDKDKHGNSILEGTLLMDFVQHCILDLVEAVTAEFKFLNKNEIDAIENGATGMVSAERRKFITVLNLIYQLVKQVHGRYIFLSYREHLILRDLYRQLRCVLQSATFCGMFQDENFPDYPFPESGMTTIFGKNCHARTKLHPNGKLLYSYAGDDNTINVYDVEKGQLIEVLQMPLAQGAVVAAITFSPDGKLLYAAGSVNGVDTVLGVARIGKEHKWEPAVILCNINITEMEAAPDQEEMVYAVGKGLGLFFLNNKMLRDSNKPRPLPAYAFNAVGHLAIDFNRGVALCTASSQDNSDQYDQVVGCRLDRSAEDEDGQPPSFVLPLRAQAGAPLLTGTDGIAIRSMKSDNDALYVVVDSVNAGNKSLLTYLLDQIEKNEQSMPISTLSLEDTSIALAYNAKIDRLLLTLEDSFRVIVVTAKGDSIKVSRVPVQIQPVDVVVDGSSGQAGQVYVLNYISNTISVIPAAELMVDEAFLDKLVNYRNDVLEVCYDLFGNLLQYLKDCFCHHFLVKCPDCDGDEVLYLANVEIRDNQVYKICNFDKRKYVKSFPMMEYWLSLVPVIPLIKMAFSKFCCWILPDLFGSNKPSRDEQTIVANGDTYTMAAASTRRTLSTYNRTDIKGTFRNQIGSMKLLSRLAGDGVFNFAQKQNLADAGVSKQVLMDSPVNEATKTLADNNIEVVDVKAYDPREAPRYMANYTATPQRLVPGSRVTLIEQNGKVMFYSIEKETAGAGSSVAEVDVTDASRKLDELERRKSEITDLSGANSELDALRAQVETLKAEREAEAKQLAAMNATRTQIASDLTELNKNLVAMQKMQQEVRLEVARSRPVKDLSGVSAEIDGSLREAGIRTVEELANAKPAALSKDAGIDRTTATAIIKEAKLRLQG